MALMHRQSYFGVIAYHVAHPNVKCLIIDKKPNERGYISALFEEPVSFPTEFNYLQGRMGWDVNIDLLFLSPEEAIENHDSWKEKQELQKRIAESLQKFKKFEYR